MPSLIDAVKENIIDSIPAKASEEVREAFVTTAVNALESGNLQGRKMILIELNVNLSYLLVLPISGIAPSRSVAWELLAGSIAT